MYSVQDTAEAVGFPIRKSADQSLFAAPRGLSQRTTSFIASQRQGIHRMPLRHLITLIVDARRVLWTLRHDRRKDQCSSRFARPRSVNSAVCIGCSPDGAAFGQIFSSRCQESTQPIADATGYELDFLRTPIARGSDRLATP